MGVLKLEVFNKNNDSEFKKDYINHLNCIEAKRNIKYIDTLKRDGGERKDIKIRWHDFKYFTEEDHLRKNNWSILGF